MTLQLDLTEAIGVLSPNPDFSHRDDPLLRGHIDFELNELGIGQDLRLRIQAWPNLEKGSLGYILDVAGLPGELWLVEPGAGKFAHSFEGAIGAHRELRVNAWRRQVSPGSELGLTLLVHSLRARHPTGTEWLQQFFPDK